MRLAVAELEHLAGDTLTWREVMAGGPAWLRWELCATPAARAKLRDWLQRIPRPWQTPKPENVYTALSFVGDSAIHAAVARLLCELPPPVCDYAVARVTFIGAGVRTLGWCGARPDFGERPWCVVLSGVNDADGRDRLRDLAAHELAHAWLGDEPAADQVAAGAFFMETAHDIPLEELPGDRRELIIRHRAEYARHEALARALVRALGFRDAA